MQEQSYGWSVEFCGKRVGEEAAKVSNSEDVDSIVKVLGSLSYRKAPIPLETPPSSDTLRKLSRA